MFDAGEEGEWEEISKGADSEFLGYDTEETTADIRRIRRDGDRITVILSQTPFYGESGGQVGDTGEITGKGFRIIVEDTQRDGDLILHKGKLVEGKAISDPSVTASVDSSRRLSIARNHTATHLLHKALKEVLGDHVNQAGSLVAPDRLRFDFTHFEAMTPDQLDEVERRVNIHVREDLRLEKYRTTLDEAKAQGATALFGEKYDEEVRVVKVNDYSMELCGGTHLHQTGEIGYFRILREEGIAAGVRRIEAVTGVEADCTLREEKRTLAAVGQLLRCRPDEVIDRVEGLMEERKDLERQVKKAQQFSASSEVDTMVEGASEIEGVRVVASVVDVASIDELRAVGDRLRNRLKSGIGVLGTLMEKKVHILCVVTDDLIREKGVKAGDIVKEVAKITGGSGGGKPHMALAGGKDVKKLDAALAGVAAIVSPILAKKGKGG
jgi:alanyl-tRNA synthetase